MKQANDPPRFLWVAVDADIVASGDNGLTGNPVTPMLDWANDYRPQQTSKPPP